MMFGAMGNPDHDESIRMIHTALDAGINFVDTADVYSQGESEEIVGKALKGRRDDVVLATKFALPIGAGAGRRGGSPRWIKRAVEDSLRRLGTDHIDLYQMHRPDWRTISTRHSARCRTWSARGRSARSAPRRSPPS
jgi:aryl-alcohol dehydrogenase-like predicted oxidoreductase